MSVITLFGSSQIQPDDARYDQGMRLGRRLAQAGHTICSGGYDGLMAAVSRGARSAGGHTLGITLERFAQDANPWIVEEQRMPDFVSRLQRMIELGDGYLVLEGGIGTLTELSLTWSLLQIGSLDRKPFIIVGDHWAHVIERFKEALIIRERDYALLQLADTPEEAVKILNRSFQVPKE
jgi:hypothetical protein